MNINKNVVKTFLLLIAVAIAIVLLSIFVLTTYAAAADSMTDVSGMSLLPLCVMILALALAVFFTRYMAHFITGHVMTGHSSAISDDHKDSKLFKTSFSGSNTKRQKTEGQNRRYWHVFSTLFVIFLLLCTLGIDTQIAKAEEASISTVGSFSTVNAGSSQWVLVDSYGVDDESRTFDGFNMLYGSTSWSATDAIVVFNGTQYGGYGHTVTVTVQTRQSDAGAPHRSGYLNYSYIFKVDGVTKYTSPTYSNFAMKSSHSGASVWTFIGGLTLEVAPVTLTTSHVNPIVTNSPTLTKPLGTPVNWAEGITATWGQTTTNTIPSMGSITDTSLVGGTDTTLSSTGAVWDRIGWKTHNYTIKDSHSLSTLYPSDNTFVNTSRLIIVQAADAPDLNIKYSSSAVDPFTGLPIAGDSYTGNWTNQPLNITGICINPGTYDIAIRRNGGNVYSNSVTGPNSYTVSNYNTATGVAGDNFSSILLGTGNHSITHSPESALQNVKIDRTNPVAGATYDSTLNSFADNSADALSGLRADLSKIALVYNGTAAPSDASYKTFAELNSATIPAGYYDVYVWAWDEAGNNVKSAVLKNILIRSSYYPDIGGELASGTSIGSTHPSNTWTNQNVKIIAIPDVNEPGFYTAVYDGAVQVAKSAAINAAVNITYSAETSGINLIARLVNSTDTVFSKDSVVYILKIDKTKPDGALIYNAGVPNHGFTDASTDSNSAIANSGIDSTKTRVAVVLAGSPQPAASAYVLISDGSAVIPNTDFYYDVWVIATDFAGNENEPVIGLHFINYALTDQIKARDFAWDIDSGSAALTDPVAVMLAHVDGNAHGSGMKYNTNDFLVDASELSNIKNAIDAGQKGTFWPLTFYTPTGPNQANKTVSVKLFDHGPDAGIDTPDLLNPPTPLSHELIYANDFEWGISSGSLGTDMTKILSKVTAYDNYGSPILVGSIDVNTTELAMINSAVAANDTGSIWSLTFYTPDMTGTTVNVTLYDNGPVIPPRFMDEYIVANDFVWGISTGSLTDAVAKHLSGVTATGANGAPMNVAVNVITNSADLTAINAGQVGDVFTLRFTTDGSSGGVPSTVMVNVTLYDDGPVTPPGPGDEYIVANDFAWGISTGSLTDVIAKQLSGVFATDANGMPVNVTNHVTVNPADLAAINTAITANQVGSVFTLTFTTDGASGGTPSVVTINVTLYDNGPVTPPGPGDEYIAANDFAWGISTGPLSGTVAKHISGVFATGVNGMPMNVASHVIVNPADLAAINTAIAANQVGGVFTLKFTTDGSSGGAPSTVTVKVTLYNNGPVTPPGSGDEYIAANDFAWGISTGSLSDVIAKQISGVFAADVNGVPMNVMSHVIVNSTDLAAINAAVAANQVGGVFTLKFTTDGSSGGAPSTVTVKVTLYNNGPVTPPGPGDEYIAANDFAWGISTGSLSDAVAKQISGVFAVDVNGMPMNVTNHVIVSSADLAAINAAIAANQVGGVFTLNFTTDGSSGGAPSTVTVKVTLYNNGPVTPPGPGDEYIAANDFAWGISTGSLSDVIAKQISGVFAVDVNGVPMNVTNHVIVNPADLAAINAAVAANHVGGVFTLKFTTDGSSGGAPSTVTVKVTLYNNGPMTPPGPGDEYIAANDFAWGISTGSLSDVIAKQISGVFAMDVNGVPMNVTNHVIVNPTDLAAINAAIAANQVGRIFTLNFTTDGSSGGTPSTVTVKVTLYNNGPVTPPGPGDEYIAANDFAWGISTGPLSGAVAKQLSGVFAADMNGVPLNVTNNVSVDAADLAAINAAVAANQTGGVFTLNFTTDGSSGGTPSTVTVSVTLYNNGPVTPPGPGDEYIAANNFPWGINTVPSLDDAVAKQLSGVIAIGADSLPMNVTNNVSVNATELADISAAVAAGQKGTVWPLTFETDGSTGNAAAVKINVTLYDYGPVTPPGPNDEYIAANNFSWPASKGNLTDADAKQLSGVVAIGINGLKMNVTNNVGVNVTELNDINTAVAARQFGSVWPLTFETDGSSGGTPYNVTVNVTVSGSNSGSGSGNATVITPQTPGNQWPSLFQPSQPEGSDQNNGGSQQDPIKQHAFRTTYSLLGILLLILSILLAVVEGLRIYKQQKKEEKSNDNKSMIYRAFVIIAAIAVVVAFFIMYSFSGSMVYYIWMYDAILLAIFVCESIFFLKNGKSV